MHGKNDFAIYLKLQLALNITGLTLRFFSKVPVWVQRPNESATVPFK